METLIVSTLLALVLSIEGENKMNIEGGDISIGDPLPKICIVCQITTSSRFPNVTVSIPPAEDFSIDRVTNKRINQHLTVRSIVNTDAITISSCLDTPISAYADHAPNWKCCTTADECVKLENEDVDRQRRGKFVDWEDTITGQRVMHRAVRVKISKGSQLAKTFRVSDDSRWLRQQVYLSCARETQNMIFSNNYTSVPTLREDTMRMRTKTTMMMNEKSRRDYAWYKPPVNTYPAIEGIFYVNGIKVTSGDLRGIANPGGISLQRDKSPYCETDEMFPRTSCFASAALLPPDSKFLCHSFTALLSIDHIRVYNRNGFETHSLSEEWSRLQQEDKGYVYSGLTGNLPYDRVAGDTNKPIVTYRNAERHLIVSIPEAHKMGPVAITPCDNTNRRVPCVDLFSIPHPKAWARGMADFATLLKTYSTYERKIADVDFRMKKSPKYVFRCGGNEGGEMLIYANMRCAFGAGETGSGKHSTHDFLQIKDDTHGCMGPLKNLPFQWKFVPFQWVRIKVNGHDDGGAITLRRHPKNRYQNQQLPNYFLDCASYHYHCFHTARMTPLASVGFVAPRNMRAPLPWNSPDSRLYDENLRKYIDRATLMGPNECLPEKEEDEEEEEEEEEETMDTYMEELSMISPATRDFEPDLIHPSQLSKATACPCQKRTEVCTGDSAPEDLFHYPINLPEYTCTDVFACSAGGDSRSRARRLDDMVREIIGDNLKLSYFAYDVAFVKDAVRRGLCQPTLRYVDNHQLIISGMQDELLSKDIQFTFNDARIVVTFDGNDTIYNFLWTSPCTLEEDWCVRKEAKGIWILVSKFNISEADSIRVEYLRLLLRGNEEVYLQTTNTLYLNHTKPKNDFDCAPTVFVNDTLQHVVAVGCECGDAMQLEIGGNFIMTCLNNAAPSTVDATTMKSFEVARPPNWEMRQYYCSNNQPYVLTNVGFETFYGRCWDLQKGKKGDRVAIPYHGKSLSSSLPVPTRGMYPLKVSNAAHDQYACVPDENYFRYARLNMTTSSSAVEVRMVMSYALSHDSDVRIRAGTHTVLRTTGGGLPVFALDPKRLAPLVHLRQKKPRVRLMCRYVDYVSQEDNKLDVTREAMRLLEEVYKPPPFELIPPLSSTAFSSSSTTTTTTTTATKNKEDFFVTPSSSYIEEGGIKTNTDHLRRNIIIGGVALVVGLVTVMAVLVLVNRRRKEKRHRSSRRFLAGTVGPKRLNSNTEDMLDSML